MNFIELIYRNHFLKQLYPEGIKSLSVCYLTTDFSRLYIRIRTQDKPAIFVEKYGEWNKDYDTMEFELIGGTLSSLNVNSWNSRHNEPCSFEIKKVDDKFLVKFWENDKWSIEILGGGLTFQSCKTYIKEEEDYIVL